MEGWVGFPLKDFVRGVAHPVSAATRAKTQIQGGGVVGTPTTQVGIPKTLKDSTMARSGRAEDALTTLHSRQPLHLTSKVVGSPETYLYRRCKPPIAVTVGCLKCAQVSDLRCGGSCCQTPSRTSIQWVATRNQQDVLQPPSLLQLHMCTS